MIFSYIYHFMTENYNAWVVVIDDFIATKAQKLEQLKATLNDPLFLADKKEVQNDFDAADHETL